MEGSFFPFLSLLVELSVDLSAEESRVDDREKRKVETRPGQNRTRLKMLSSRRVAPHRTAPHKRMSEAKPREGGIRSQTCQGKAMTRKCVLCCAVIRLDSIRIRFTGSVGTANNCDWKETGVEGGALTHKSRQRQVMTESWTFEFCNA
jgi:hypothetical protein